LTATPWLWAAFTIAAAFAQTIRNAMQRELTAGLGTVGATQVRFLFGFPFALVFLAILLAVSGAPLPVPGFCFWPWVIAGALTQIAATALMLAAMGERSFVVTIAYIKTEPIQVAIFGFIFPPRHGDVVDGRGHSAGDGRRDCHLDKTGRHDRRNKADIVGLGLGWRVCARRHRIW
jgi:hypothetical protein